MRIAAPRFVLSSLLLLSTVGASACYVQDTGPQPAYSGEPTYYEGDVAVGSADYEYPSMAPPEPIYEQPPPPPSYGYVWIDGYWNWAGARWVWWRGHWESPHEGYVYVQPYYSYQGGRQVYVRGHWGRQDNLPRGVVVRDHTDGRPPTAVWNNNTYRPRTAPMPVYTPQRPTTVVPSAAPPPRPTTVVPYNEPPPRPTTVVPSAAPPPRPTTVVPYNAPPPRPTTVVPSAAPPPRNTVVVPPARGNPHGTPPGQTKKEEKDDDTKVKVREHRKDD